MRLSPLLCFMACAGGFLASPHAANARIERQHGAHVHGVTTITIAQDGQQLSVGMEMPGVNVVGYEHPPHSAGEQAKLDAAIEVLREPGQWFVPNAEALCRVSSVEVHPNGFGDDSAPSGAAPKANAAAAHEHADVDVAYQYACSAPLNLRSIDLRLIERFPGTHEVRVDIVSAGGQAQEVLSTPHAEITFSPNSP